LGGRHSRGKCVKKLLLEVEKDLYNVGSGTHSIELVTQGDKRLTSGVKS
jgi:hypothetical protein